MQLLSQAGGAFFEAECKKTNNTQLFKTVYCAMAEPPTLARVLFGNFMLTAHNKNKSHF